MPVPGHPCRPASDTSARSDSVSPGPCAGRESRKRPLSRACFATRAEAIRPPDLSSSRSAQNLPWPSHGTLKLGQGTLRADTLRCRSSRLQPGLSHGAFDNMPLNPAAMWAGKGSQVLAQRARLDRRQLIGEPQAVHCGPRFCVSSIASLPQFGALSSPVSQPVASDLKGSDAMMLIST